MAELYLAKARGPAGFEKAVAIKVVHPHLVDDPHSIRMFMREARVAAGLDHPNIVQVIDFGCDAGEYYLAMEYVHGRDARKAMSAMPAGEPLPLACALFIVAAVADALHFAHTAGSHAGTPLRIVHRDVSPANILLGYGGAVKLGDFGIAKFVSQGTSTGTGVIKGKPGYMAPEQCLHDDLDGRCDVFALGVVLYELTTAKRAFSGLNPAALMNRVLAGNFVKPTSVRPLYPPKLAAIVERAMAVEVDDRTESARALSQQLHAFASGEGITLSQSGFAAWFEEQFGGAQTPSLHVAAEPPRPVSAQERAAVTEASTVALGATDRRRARVSRSKVAALALGTLGLGTLMGWQIAGGSRDEPPAPVTSDPLRRVVEAQPKPDPRRPAPAPGPSLTKTTSTPNDGSDAPKARVNGSSTLAQTPPDATEPSKDAAGAANTAASPPAERTRAKRRGSQRRKSSRRDADPAPPPSGGRDAMFPSSARP